MRISNRGKVACGRMDVGGRRWLGPAGPEAGGAFKPNEASNFACRSLSHTKIYSRVKFLVYTSKELLLHHFSELNSRHTRDLLTSWHASPRVITPSGYGFCRSNFAAYLQRTQESCAQTQ